jgi:hypothetical protein
MSSIRVVAKVGFLALAALVGVSTLTCPALEASAQSDGGRIWHVSPEELSGIDAGDQFRTISGAAAKAEAGDTVLIHGGTYRESVTVEQSGTAEKPIRFEAATGERVVVTGADELREWRKEPGANVYSTPWPHKFVEWSESGTHPGDDYHRMIGRCEQVFIRGFPLLQVLECSALSRGTFVVDGGRLYVCPRDGADLSDEAPLVEASARQVIWHNQGEHIQLRGLRFRYAANQAQQGAARFEGAHGVVEDCVFESTNSCGASFVAENLTVRRCVFQDNGQLGFGAARAHNLLVSECVVRNNNVKGFDRGWEAGGDKLVLCRDAVLEKSQFVGNRGNGIWFDIGNEGCEVRNCMIADNEDCGIFYEISYGLKAHDNVILGNGFGETPGSWGAGAGISLSSSPDCQIERNLLVGNREGFAFREQGRTTPRIDDEAERPIWNHDQFIRNNVIALNRDAQVWGWFDIDDGRHWPAGLKDASEKARSARETGELTLEKLAIRFDGNVYDARPWQGLFHWGADWKRNKKYASLADLRAELKFEVTGQATEFKVANYAARDFRVPADSPLLKAKCYPRGEVPGVRLGLAD